MCKADKLVPVFLDAFGRPLFTLKRKAWSLNQVYEARNTEGERIFTAKSAFSCEWQSCLQPQIWIRPLNVHCSVTKTLMNATFTNEYDDRQMTVKIEGRWKERQAEMRCGDRLVAFIDMRKPGRYSLEVAPGVDLALVTALALAFNESSQSENTSAWS